MAKRRIKNNFGNWLTKSLPFFLVVFFVFFNISFFMFNSSTYKRKNIKSGDLTLKQFSNESTFDFAVSIHDRQVMKESLEMYKMEHDEYPYKLEDAVGNIKNKNWIYIKSADRYILQYR